MLTAHDLLDDPAASFWLRDALRAALDRDPVDAARDAVLLARALLVQAHGHDERAAGGRVDLRAVMPFIAEIEMNFADDGAVLAYLGRYIEMLKIRGRLD